MLKVGITGGIGSGKSYICEVFQKLGISIYSADRVARTISSTSNQVVQQITNIFGKDAYSDGLLDRKYIASLVFNNSDLLQQLNGIIHPAIEIDFKHWCKLHVNESYILKEAAILFESGSNKMLDKVIAISAPEELRIKRVIDRDSITPDEVMRRMENQWNTDRIIPLADFVIENNDKNLILPQIIEIDKNLRK